MNQPCARLRSIESHVSPAAVLNLPLGVEATAAAGVTKLSLESICVPLPASNPLSYLILRVLCCVSQPAAGHELKLLSDAQMQQFLGQGFLILQPDELEPAFHQAVFENAAAEYGPGAGQKGGSHGTTIERVPGLTTLIESPTVAGALHSLLGPEYAHGHLGPSGCAFHASGGPGGPGQPFHKDTQRAQITGHRTRAVMVMYPFRN